MSLVPFNPRKGAVTQRTGSSKQVVRIGQNMPKPRVIQVRDEPVEFNNVGGPPFAEPPKGTVLKVSGELMGSYGVGAGRVYDYAIIRANNGRWYTSGSTCPVEGYDWRGLLRFLMEFKSAKGVRLC